MSIELERETLETLAAQVLVQVDPIAEVFVVWNGSETFQAIAPDGTVRAFWMNDHFAPPSPFDVPDVAGAAAWLRRVVRRDVVLDEDNPERDYLEVWAQ